VSYEVAAAGSLCASIALLWWWHKGGDGDRQAPPKRTTSVTLAKAPAWAPAATLPVVESSRLLGRPEIAQLVRSIIGKSGLSGSNVECDLVPLIESYASFVQMLPASEAHHHAQPGGMLAHTLEVVDYALSYRRSYMLPLGAGAERVNELKHVWTMAVILVAMFHDIGKPMSDLCVTLYASHGIGREGRRWTPLAGPMASQGATHYHVDFNRDRKYEHHTELSVIMMQRLVPTHVLAWIGEQDEQLLPKILESLGPGADRKSILVDITRRADQESTKVNLLNGPRTRFLSARETPLVDVLDEALNRLIASGRLRLNVPGGHGFVDGEDLLLVVPRVLDEIRAFLSQALIGGSRGIPQDNLILYSTWMDFGRLTPQSGAARADGSRGPPRAVWRVRVVGIPTTLTVLRFPRNSPALRALMERWPGPYGEAISVVELEDTGLTQVRDAEEALQDTHQTVDAVQTAGERVLAPAMAANDVAMKQIVAASMGLDVAPSTSAQNTTRDAIDMPDFLLEMTYELPGQVEQDKPIRSANILQQEQVLVEQLQRSGGLMVAEEENPLNALLARPNVAVPNTSRTSARTSAIPPMKIKTPGASAPKSELLEQFEDWLRLGLQSGHVAYNSGQAMVHFHQIEIEGSAKTVALFVTPAIYQRFAKERDSALAQTPLPEVPRAAWLPVQTALLKAHAHRKEHLGKISKTIFRFATKSGGVFGANVLIAPQKIFTVTPEPNPYISGEVKESSLTPTSKNAT